VIGASSTPRKFEPRLAALKACADAYRRDTADGGARLYRECPLLALAGTANASGPQSYYNCGDGAVVIISEWHGKMFLDVEDNGKNIGGSQKKFYDAGIDTLDKNPEKLNTNSNGNFRLPVKWHGKTVTFRYREGEVTFAGHLCRPMGGQYDDEVHHYNDDPEKYLKEHRSIPWYGLVYIYLYDLATFNLVGPTLFITVIVGAVA
jgi:hypothetical protein